MREVQSHDDQLYYQTLAGTLAKGLTSENCRIVTLNGTLLLIQQSYPEISAKLSLSAIQKPDEIAVKKKRLKNEPNPNNEHSSNMDSLVTAVDERR